MLPRAPLMAIDTSECRTPTIPLPFGANFGGLSPDAYRRASARDGGLGRLLSPCLPLAPAGHMTKCARWLRPLAYRGFESPPLRFGKPRIVCRDPVAKAGLSRVSGEFGGNSVANSTIVSETRRTRTHRIADPPDSRAGASREDQGSASVTFVPLPERYDEVRE
jgi:hypothetical protein